MKIGNSEIEKLYIGEDEVDKLYLGTDLIYEESTPVDNNIYIMFDGVKHLMTLEGIFEGISGYSFSDDLSIFNCFSIYKGNTVLTLSEDFEAGYEVIKCGEVIETRTNPFPSGDTEFCTEQASYAVAIIITPQNLSNNTFKFEYVQMFNEDLGGDCDCPEEPCEEGFIWNTETCSCEQAE